MGDYENVITDRATTGTAYIQMHETHDVVGSNPTFAPIKGELAQMVEHVVHTLHRLARSKYQPFGKDGHKMTHTEISREHLSSSAYVFSHLLSIRKGDRTVLCRLAKA